MSKRFQKRVEDFVCEKCGFAVKSNGFTNHCPKCLYSKHVDVNPGDREANCGGLMAPVDFVKDKTNYMLTHRCELCGFEKRNRLAPEDDFDKALEIVKKKAAKLTGGN
jgi:rubrerythrin